MTTQRGTLFLVVGPSGAGKDSLIQAAKARLANDSRFVFPPRIITRASPLPGEDYIHSPQDGFQMAEEGNAFMLHWHTYGHAYGIPGYVSQYLDQGRHVIVNSSRDCITDAIARFSPVIVFDIHVAMPTAFQRLKERGREDEEEIAKRLKRYDHPIPDHATLVTIDNNGPFEASVQAIVSRLLAVAGD
ncbi:phosphonate metabolism protein/1,5-bisphosphokinase (PRPP-forming) PhnN [Aestuariispira ectoiniformans]|uniref:phosphonate metabolism protein/1,5-bisphosphokinase (PRPP-forming) PhnN n=1 Tax=Aestuariispira ectoiniformans TaxID=2775080 RepID=UPI00223BB258|nr:phosphonate metabolism protein/1,5-bisphosphokinase (PRPP-forming) PhnN [Aestuariispira ectoiniformans]